MTPSKQRISKAFSKHHLFYQNNAEMQKSIAQHLATKFCPLIPGKILEIGCGTGFLTENILKTFQENSYLGVDISEAMIEFCKERFPNGHFAVQDGENLHEIGEYSAIFSSMTLQWFLNLEQSMVNIKKSLKKGGYFFFTFPNASSYPEWDFFPLNPLPSHDVFSSYNPSLEEISFEKTYETPLDFLHELKHLGVSTPIFPQTKKNRLKQLIKDSKCGKMNPMTITTKITVGYIHV